jgi:hypothetical protein
MFAYTVTEFSQHIQLPFLPSIVFIRKFSMLGPCATLSLLLGTHPLS